MFLTRRQTEVLEYVREHVRATGYAPTLAEIGEHLGLRSPATVYKHVQHLVRKGYLRKSPHQGRGIEPVEQPPPRAVEVPILGEIAAGYPIEPPRFDDRVAIPPGLVGRRPTFALRARDASLISAAVLRGDLLIVEDRGDLHEGDTVIARSADGTVVLGSLERAPGGLRLLPSGPLGHAQPRPLDDDRIVGVVVGLVRSYDSSDTSSPPSPGRGQPRSPR